MNAIKQLLSIQYPIIQGAMAWVAEASLASAVSAGGGLGIIAAGNAPVDWVRRQIETVRAKTDQPFGVNVMLMSDTADQVAELVAQLKVPVVTTGAGSPGKYMEIWKQAGVKVLPVIPSVALAKRMERMGADAVIAEGCEAGGHIGELTTMALTPQVVDAVAIPVVTAGGVADGRGMAAAFCLGAGGVQVGTRFLAAKECVIHQNFKDKVIGAKDTDTVVTGRSTGLPIRSLKNKMTKQFLTMEAQGCDRMELERLGIGALRKAVVEGDADGGSFMCGQVAGLVKEEQPAAEILRQMTESAKALIPWMEQEG